jgi:hypothetical protein
MGVLLLTFAKKLVFVLLPTGDCVLTRFMDLKRSTRRGRRRE